VAQEFGFIDDDGKPNVEKTEEFLRSVAPPEYTQQLIDASKECWNGW